ncbi:MAG: hypothetical protein COV10_00080 [Candidatus Vogelbacteria bacterium CG10_big_fil_rev_8_21_14_0_10_51_16]|uniref:RNA polymerase sigma factor n=1 Tax=Candidatus Vogelbacteria bacterium CG10_big_fil_rev_8_21_14_0_10_51_16 TaxID=1975045 RepID=A0A2H0RFD5_9BACT|nr:MAG: hypothetical protein COV10_00080 [Candidatus Vogelbacteria bacterium CG10_big_fil_rev_8_21_14_0_10_51_16]
MEVPDVTQQEFLNAYDLYADAIFRHCFFRTSNREHAEDLAQETFLRVWQYLERGGKIDNIKAFLYRVANNLVVDGFRKKRSSSLDRMQEEGFDPVDDSLPSEEVRLDVARALRVLDELEPQFRDVMTMRYIDELSPREISEILGQTENAVSVRLHRGLKRARELLESARVREGALLEAKREQDEYKQQSIKHARSSY